MFYKQKMETALQEPPDFWAFLFNSLLWNEFRKCNTFSHSFGRLYYPWYHMAILYHTLTHNLAHFAQDSHMTSLGLYKHIKLNYSL